MVCPRSAQTRRGTPGSHPPALLSPLFPDKPGDRTPGSRGTWSRSGLASPASPLEAGSGRGRPKPPAPTTPSPQPVLPCPLASGPVWALLVPKSAEARKGARPYRSAVFLEAHSAPLAAHSHPCPPAIQHSQTFFSPGPLASWWAVLGSGPASAPTCTLCRCWAPARPLVTALFLRAGHPGAPFPHCPQAACFSHHAGTDAGDG